MKNLFRGGTTESTVEKIEDLVMIRPECFIVHPGTNYLVLFSEI